MYFGRTPKRKRGTKEGKEAGGEKEQSQASGKNRGLRKREAGSV